MESFNFPGLSNRVVLNHEIHYQGIMVGRYSLTNTPIYYVAPGLERMLKRKGLRDRFDLRRRALAERVLARV